MVAGEPSVTRGAVENHSSASEPSNRLSSLVEGFTESVASRLTSLWSRSLAVRPGRSNSGVSNSSPLAGIFPTSSTLSRANAFLFSQGGVEASSSNTFLSSQPVLVSTYSRIRSSPTASSAPQSMTANTKLPSVDAFSFDGILRAIEPEIHEAIDGIAEIYARSKLSLADAHDAHLPPQGEIAGLRPRQHGLALRTAGLERTLTTVTEASSSSERLNGGSKPGSIASGRGKATAYGSLRSIISRGRSSSRSSAPPESRARHRAASPAWSIQGEKERVIMIRRQNTAPMAVSLATVVEAPRDKNMSTSHRAEEDNSTQFTFGKPQRPASWLSWSRSWSGQALDTNQPRRADAMSSLKTVLENSTGPSIEVR